MGESDALLMELKELREWKAEAIASRPGSVGCDDCRDARRAAEANLRRYADALMLAWGGVMPPTWAVDPTNPMLMAECIRARGDELQARERDLENSVCRLEFERDEARRQRDALLVALKPMLFAPATRGERRLNDDAQAAIAFAEGAATLPRHIAAKLT